jgi:serine/threonine protein kinase/Tol biopolymer transport system component
MADESWHKVREIFDAALRREPAARRQFVSQACDGDAGLLAEVESLLSSFDEVGDFMEKPAIYGVADEVLADSRKLREGQRLGHYEIIRPLGAGGMGEVFLARDTKLHRQVALKLLPPASAFDTEADQRLLREAQAAAALDHPNICAVHEIGEADGSPFIVMQYLEGETLAARLRRGRVSPNQAVGVALQIADALTEAHARGIIHRDIKPSNVIITTPRRQVKVLDFSLAKNVLAEGEPAGGATPSKPGLVIGTVAYMSPEQARGQELDARTDLWSLGVVLYEMLAGALPFSGATNSDTIAAILTAEPAPLREAPPPLAQIVNKALAKDRTWRYQTASEMLSALKRLRRDAGDTLPDDAPPSARDASTAQRLELSTDGLTGSTVAVAPPAPSPPSPADKRRWRWAGAALAALLLGFTGWAWWRLRAKNAGPPFTYAVSPVANWKRDLGEDLDSPARFSPDGKLIAFASTRSGVSAIWLKQIGGGEPFTRKEDDWPESSPVFAPDGQQIAFLSKRGEENGIWARPTLGGAPTLLKTLEGGSRELLKWSKDGATIYYKQGYNVFALSLASRQTAQLTAFPAAPSSPANFDLSADESRLAYADKQNGQSDIWFVATNGGAPVRVTDDEFVDSHPVWHRDGRRIIYSSLRRGLNQLFVVGLDGSPPVQLIYSDTPTYANEVSPDGAQVLYYTMRDDLDLWRVRVEDGKESRLTETLGLEFWPDVSPDSANFVYQATRAEDINLGLVHTAILAQPAGANQSLQLTDDGFLPRWSPDGKRVAFLRQTERAANLWTVAAHGGEARQLTSDGISFGGYQLMPLSPLSAQDYQWSPDGRSVVYCAHRGNLFNLWQARADGSGETQLTRNTDPSVRYFTPFLAPDGQSLAWLGLFLPGGAQKKFVWGVWTLRDGQTKLLHQSESVLRPLGWLQNGRELLVKTVAGANHDATLPAQVSLLKLSLSGELRPLAQLDATYFRSLRLAPDKQTVAYVARPDGTDGLYLAPLAGGPGRALLTGNDTRVYFAGLSWSPDGRAIYFGRQANWQIISTIDNFK